MLRKFSSWRWYPAENVIKKHWWNDSDRGSALGWKLYHCLRVRNNSKMWSLDIVFQYYVIVKDRAYISLTQSKGNQDFYLFWGCWVRLGSCRCMHKCLSLGRRVSVVYVWLEPKLNWLYSFFWNSPVINFVKMRGDVFHLFWSYGFIPQTAGRRDVKRKSAQMWKRRYVFEMNVMSVFCSCFILWIAWPMFTKFDVNIVL